MKYRMGRKPSTPQQRARVPRFADYVTRPTALPTPPELVVYYPKVKSPWGMLGNDTLGDCTIAALAHLVQCWEANALGVQGGPTLAQVEAAYKTLSPNDTGCDMVTTLEYMTNVGIGGHKIAGYAALDLGNKDQMSLATYLFGGLYIGLCLPNAIVNASDPLTIPWNVHNCGAVGNPNDGHAIAGVGYNLTHGPYLDVVTWGARIGMGLSGYDAWVDEVYAIVSSDWIETKSGLSPSGFDIEQLVVDCAGIANVAAIDEARAVALFA